MTWVYVARTWVENDWTSYLDTCFPIRATEVPDLSHQLLLGPNSPRPFNCISGIVSRVLVPYDLSAKLIR